MFQGARSDALGVVHDGWVTVPVVSAPAPRPFVSVILPIRNEVGHIEACLERLLEQDFARSSMEILVVDGCSDDGTGDVVRRVQERHADADIRLLVNVNRQVASGFNVGVRAARGDVIIRMDGHTIPARDYVSRCVSVLNESGAANVGGVIEPSGTSWFGCAVASVIQHPLGAGDAKFRVGGLAGEVDTVPFGAFRRDVFARVGLFDESMVRNEDYEFNVRVRAAGEQVYLDPSIRSNYRPRDAPGLLWSQYFQYGWWRVETWRRHPSSLRWRQAIPPGFVGAMLLVGLLGLFSTTVLQMWTLAVAGYLSIVLLTSWNVARPRAAIFAVATAFVIVHIAYGAGFLCNVVSGGRFPYRARRPDVPRVDDDWRRPLPRPGVAANHDD